MRWIIGIDEVGRGALAGPVVVAAAAIPLRASLRSRSLGKLRDSKKLTAHGREAWAEYAVREAGVKFAFARVYPRQIEKRNITGAANVAALRAFTRLVKTHKISLKTAVFLDGGLFLGSRAKQPRNAKTVIKGDEKVPAVAVASILAKVYRDRLMRAMAKRYPRYGFEVHKGYGTLRHRKAIGKFGPSAAHRLTFLGRSATISS